MNRKKKAVVSFLRHELSVLVTVLCFCSVSVASVNAQCLPNDQLVKASIAKLPISSSDNLRHATYRFVDEQGREITPSEAVITAVQRGTQQWNDQRDKTGVVFEPAAPGQPATINITRRSSDSDPQLGDGKCAAMNVKKSLLNYGPNFERRAQKKKGAAFIIAHELGHALGLSDQGVNPFPPTVMNNINQCEDLPQTSSTVTATDAMRVHGCIQTALDPLADVPIYEDRPTGTTLNGLDCYARYEVTNYYICSLTGTSCRFDHAEYAYLTTVCY
jgi:hypothetical protein